MPVRVAGSNKSGVVTDLFLVEDFVAFVEKNATTVGVRWPGGLYPLRDDERVLIGSRRRSDGNWDDPVVSVEREIENVNARVGRMFEQGFLFRDRVFSLSLASQLAALGLYNVRHREGVLPRLWPTLDDKNFVQLITVEDVEEFYAAQTQAVLDLRAVAAGHKKALREPETSKGG